VTLCRQFAPLPPFILGGITRILTMLGFLALFFARWFRLSTLCYLVDSLCFCIELGRDIAPHHLRSSFLLPLNGEVHHALKRQPQAMLYSMAMERDRVSSADLRATLVHPPLFSLQVHDNAFPFTASVVGGCMYNFDIWVYPDQRSEHERRHVRLQIPTPFVS
jgi:hypothetical protein